MYIASPPSELELLENARKVVKKISPDFIIILQSEVTSFP